MFEWIYCPVSGDRVFCVKACPGIASIKWPNNSRHVFGGIKLVYNIEGEFDDTGLRNVASQVIDCYGGVAWQENKDFVAVIVPHDKAVRVSKLFSACFSGNENYAVRVGSGIPSLNPIEGLLLKAGCLEMALNPESGLCLKEKEVESYDDFHLFIEKAMVEGKKGGPHTPGIIVSVFELGDRVSGDFDTVEEIDKFFYESVTAPEKFGTPVIEMGKTITSLPG